MNTAAESHNAESVDRRPLRSGLAKGSALRWKALGLAQPSTSENRIHRSHAAVHEGRDDRGLQGSAWFVPTLGLAPYVDEDNPELYVGFGPKSLEHAGRVYDGAHLHTFMSDQALANAVGQVRAGEVSAGRKPGTVKVWSVLATACDVSEEKYLKYIVARLATYLQIPGYGDKLVEINGWNPDTLRSFRSHTAVTSVGGAIDVGDHGSNRFIAS